MLLPIEVGNIHLVKFSQYFLKISDIMYTKINWVVKQKMK